MLNNDRKAFSIIALLIAAVVVSALVVVYNSYLNRQLFINLNSLGQQYDNLRIEHGRLQLEYGTWASPAFIEQVAAQKLRMRAPENGQMVLIPASLGRADGSESERGHSTGQLAEARQR